MSDQNDLIYITVAVENVEHKYLALRQTVAELTDDDGKTVASISTTAGLGGDAVFLEWNGRVGVVRMSHLLRQWVASFDADGARRLPITGPPEVAPPAPDPPKGNFSGKIEQAMEEAAERAAEQEVEDGEG